MEVLTNTKYMRVFQIVIITDINDLIIRDFNKVDKELPSKVSIKQLDDFSSLTTPLYLRHITPHY